MLGLWAWRADSSHLQPWALPRASSYTHRAQYVANCTTLYLNLYSTYTPVPSTSVYSYVNTSSITQINLAWIQLCCYLNLCNNFPPSSAANQAIPNKMARLVCSYGGSGFKRFPRAYPLIPRYQKPEMCFGLCTLMPWRSCVACEIWGQQFGDYISTVWRLYKGIIVCLTTGNKL